ncbi:uncharacterized protein TNCV_4760961 [Trichonephila clavipes]|uniref:Uncharacterized protein n=1 Tax=Trichonephila clavipes TaxID=2585209 RepID=A0A8X6RIK1_TRICX|nr:uncharacterized protein TNCV_4760961 [Trichonephila clavipes]
MTGTLPPLLDSVVGGGTPGRSCNARLWIQCCYAGKSPFAIQKALIAIGGEPKSGKRLCSGDLLIETISALQTKSFLLAKTFLNSPVSISPHKPLNTCRGVISEPDLFTIPDAKILEGFSGQAVIQTGFGPTVYSIPSMGHFLKSRIYRDVTGLRYIVQPCLLFTTPGFFRHPLSSSPVPTFFSSVVARSFSLYRLSFDLLPGAGSCSLHAPPKSKSCPLWLILPYQTPGTENSQTVTQKIHKQNTQ